jgi:hypothetical protein
MSQHTKPTLPLTTCPSHSPSIPNMTHLLPHLNSSSKMYTSTSLRPFRNPESEPLTLRERVQDLDNEVLINNERVQPLLKSSSRTCSECGAMIFSFPNSNTSKAKERISIWTLCGGWFHEHLRYGVGAGVFIAGLVALNFVRRR